MELTTCLQPYDIMKDLDNLHPQITMRQLLAIAPHSHTKLGSTMIRKRSKNVEVNDITLSQDPIAHVVDVTINNVLIRGLQVDTRSSVDLIIMEIMEELGFSNTILTSIILKMENHTCMKPLGQLSQVLVQIAVENTFLNFIVFQTTDAIQVRFGVFGRLWLIVVKAKEDWGIKHLPWEKTKRKSCLTLISHPMSWTRGGHSVGFLCTTCGGGVFV